MSIEVLKCWGVGVLKICCLTEVFFSPAGQNASTPERIIQRYVKNIAKLLLPALLLISPACFAHDGIYMTAETGWAGKTGLPSKNKVGAKSLDREDIPAWRFAVGYLHDVVPWFGLGFEAGRGIYGKYVYHFSNIHSATIRNTTTEFLVLGVLHQGSLDYIAKLGGVRNTTNIHYVYGDSNETRIQPELALGLAYTFAPHVALIGQYAHTFGEQVGTLAKPGWKSPSLNETLLGLRVTFY